MAVYEYRAIAPGGNESTGILDADSPLAARRKLRDAGLHPTELKETHDAGGASGDFSLRRLFAAGKKAELSMFTRQLAVLLDAGMTLVEALTAIIDQIDNPILKKVIFEVRDRVSEGATFSDSLSKHPDIFSKLYVNMCKAGETSGAMDMVLMRLADFTERSTQLSRKIQSALAYPILMMFIATGIVVFLMTVVIPKIANMFKNAGQSLPTVTRVLIGFCDILAVYWYLFLFGIVALSVGFKLITRTPKGRYKWDKIKLRMPLFGDLTTKICVSRFARTLGTLGESGLPLMVSLDIVRNVVQNRVIEDAIDEAKTGIRRGQGIAEPLRREKVFPPIVIHMVALGERSGQLDSMLIKVADTYDNEVESTVNMLVSLLEPLMILGMGVVVGFLVLAILLPIMSASSLAG